jgi:hypothetical protein
MKTISSARSLHDMTVAEWCAAVHVAGPNNFFPGTPTPEKRREVRHYCGQRLNRGQVSFNHSQCALWAARSVSLVRSAYDSARDAYRASFTIYRTLA